MSDASDARADLKQKVLAVAALSDALRESGLSTKAERERESERLSEALKPLVAEFLQGDKRIEDLDAKAKAEYKAGMRALQDAVRLEESLEEAVEAVRAALPGARAAGQAEIDRLRAEQVARLQELDALQWEEYQRCPDNSDHSTTWTCTVEDWKRACGGRLPLDRVLKAGLLEGRYFLASKLPLQTRERQRTENQQAERYKPETLLARILKLGPERFTKAMCLEDRDADADVEKEAAA